jgi:hypothetical protein
MQGKSQPSARAGSKFNRIQHRMHSSRMRLGPVNPAAATALGKSLMTGENVRRYSSRHEITRDRRQHCVASRASRQHNRARIETEAPDSLAQLTSDGVALDEENVGRGPQALVTRHQDSVIGSRNPEQLSAGQGRICDDIGAEQSQPAGQSHEHPVNGEAGSFIHRDALYYITVRRNRL